jgi:hypothetical protein
MKRYPVKSSMIDSVGYDPKKKILELEFTSGALWQYLKVPSSEYVKMMKAKSVGRFFLSNIQECYEEVRLR